MEEWRTVTDYENYEVSNLGNVRNKLTKQVLVPHKNEQGYLMIRMCKDKYRKRFFLHRLVAKAFLGNPENLPVVDHSDRNLNNNNVTNLRWCTLSQSNSNRSKYQGVSTSKYKGVCMVKKKWRATIQVNGEQNYIGHFNTEEEAAEAYNNAALELHGEFAVLNDLTPKQKIKVVIKEKETS